MADYIKREDAVIKAKQAVFAVFRYGKTPTENAVYENIDIAFKEQYLPSADVVEVRRGKWLWDGYVYDEPYVCNRCGARMDYESNFCPHCGAIMEEWMVSDGI